MTPEEKEWLAEFVESKMLRGLDLMLQAARSAQSGHNPVLKESFEFFKNLPEEEKHALRKVVARLALIEYQARAEKNDD